MQILVNQPKFFKKVVDIPFLMIYNWFINQKEMKSLRKRKETAELENKEKEILRKQLRLLAEESPGLVRNRDYQALANLSLAMSALYDSLNR